MEPIRVLLADDHAILRAGLAMLLNAQPDIVVVGEAENGAQAAEMARELSPDVILLDITMPGLSGIEAMGYLRREAPHTRVLVLTMHDDESYLRQLLRGGASGYLLKKAADTELTNAIRAVHAGNVYIDPSLTKALVQDFLLETRAEQPEEELTPRETEVLQYIARGYTNRQVAAKLHISVKTVESHRARIMQKLKVQTRAGLVRYALDKGWL